MEKTQSESISIIDHFASVDDPRVESTRKRQAQRHHRGRRQLGRYRILRKRQNRMVQDLPQTPQQNTVPRHIQARLFPHRRAKLPNTSSSNGQNGTGKPPKGRSRRLTARQSGAPMTRQTANPPSIWRARGRPPKEPRLDRSKQTTIPTR